MNHPRSVWRLLKLVAPYRGWVAISALLGFATVGSGIGLLATSAFIISSAALHPSIAEIQVAIVGVRFFGLARGVFRYLERYLSHQTTFRILTHLRAWFYQSLEPLAPARLLEYKAGDLVSRAISDIASLESFYVRGLAPPLVAGLTALAMLVFLGSYDGCLALVYLVFTLLAGAGLPALVGRLSRAAGRQWVDRRARLNSALVDGIQGMPDLLAFGYGEIFEQSLRQLNTGLASAQRRMAQLAGLQTALGGFLANLAMWSILLLAIPLVGSGQIAGVVLAGMVLATLASFEALTPLPSAAQHLEGNLSAARRLFEMVDAPAPVQEPPSPLPLPGEASLEVKGLRFRYPLEPGDQTAQVGEAEILDGVSFSLPVGKRLAIVGPSGSGKTTIANLLLRFWEYRGADQGGNGQILLAGRELYSYRSEDVRALIGVVSQRTHLFTGSILDNLLLARSGASPDEIALACRQAQIDEFIVSLPAGYQTWIGEQGLLLSAGQRQRLAIARALLKSAPILLLDEPTANLDTLTEKEVLAALDPLMRGRSTILITHRLVGMDKMDEILVLEAGKVVERGRHKELLVLNGLYRRMWDLQNQVFAW